MSLPNETWINYVSAAVSIHDPKRTTRTALKVVVLLSVVLTAVFVVSFFFSEQGMSELQSSRRRVQELQAGIDRLRAENEKLTAEVRMLEKSNWAVERIAREDLGMSRPGEVVYVMRQR